MRGTVAKRLRRRAEVMTGGQKSRITRRLYRRFKETYKREKVEGILA